MATARVHTVVELLDAGNTVPFITRYRKDQTGGLDEEQIGQIQSRVVKLRLLAERKQTIVRSIESQGKLTPDLAAAIQAANTTKQLEDLYLPFKPKKQTLATVARSRGLEPLALEILGADAAAADLDLRARDFVNPDRQVLNAADALLGAGHILAEMFSERAELRGKLRSILERTGKLVSTAVESEAGASKEKLASQPRAASAASAPPPPPPPPPDAAPAESREPAAGEQLADGS
ncbi:MAG: Tex-like N-terminal domain-containing protein, partial [Pirellulales bacterium]